MHRGGKIAEVTAEPSRARERIQSAVRKTDKDVGIVIPFEMLEVLRFHCCKIITVSYNFPQPQDDAPEARGTRRSARIRATKSAHPKEKDQLSPQQSHQQAPGPKTLTRSRPGAATVPDLEGDTAPAKPLAKKGKSTAPESRKSRQISRSSKPKTVSKPQRKATAKPNEQFEQDPTSQVQPSRKGAEREKAKRSGPAAGKPTRKTAKGKAKSSDPALGSSSELVPGDGSGRRGRREGSESLKYHQGLSREGVEELILNLGLVGAARDEEPTCKYLTGFLDLTKIRQILLERLILTRERNSITSTDICLLWTRRPYTSLQQSQTTRLRRRKWPELALIHKGCSRRVLCRGMLKRIRANQSTRVAKKSSLPVLGGFCRRQPSKNNSASICGFEIKPS